MKETSLSTEQKKKFDYKRLISFFAITFLLIVPTFAEGDTITALDSWGNKLLTLFTGTWVKAILLIALICEAIGMVVAGQQGGGGQMVKKFAPWIIGTIILLSASGICSYFLDGLSFSVA